MRIEKSRKIDRVSVSLTTLYDMMDLRTQLSIHGQQELIIINGVPHSFLEE